MEAPDSSRAALVRFLRFKEYDVELEHGDALIGRGEDCCVRLGDPLISRHHARIRCDARQAVVEDLGSCNGTRLNGSYVERPRALQHGDRIQIGRYELLYLEREAIRAIPEASDAIDSRPSWGSITDIAWKRPAHKTNANTRWPIDMLLELLGRAILAKHEADAAGLMKQAMAATDDMFQTTGSVDGGHLQALWEAAVWLSKTQGDPSWIAWATQAYRRSGLPEPRPKKS